MKLLLIKTNGVFFPGGIDKKGLILKNVKIILDEDKPFDVPSNIKIMEQCLNLGKYVYKNISLIEDYAISYRIYKTEENKYFITKSREDKSLTSKPFTFNDEYKNINIAKINEFNISKKKQYEPKLMFKEAFSRKLMKWIQVCGFSEADYNSITNYGFIPVEIFLHILDMSLGVYTSYQKFLVHDGFESHFNEECHIISTSEAIKITRSFKNIEDFCLFLIPYISGGDAQKIKECEYCGDIFIGRKNKKCCSNNCKDKKNLKYERRKEREQIKRDSKYRQEQI